MRDCLLRYAPSSNNILGIGCGTGFVLANLHQTYPDLQPSGSDIYTEGLGFAQQRVPSAHLFQVDACHIPYINELLAK